MERTTSLGAEPVSKRTTHLLCVLLSGIRENSSSFGSILEVLEACTLHTLASNLREELRQVQLKRSRSGRNKCQKRPAGADTAAVEATVSDGTAGKDWLLHAGASEAI